MRKFTLYQASRFTKISRYKLEQAIEDGTLKIIEGKGNVKCFIQEDELNRFIEENSDQYARISFPEDDYREKNTLAAGLDFQYVPRDIVEKLINERKETEQLLLAQNEKLMSVIESLSSK